MFSKNVNRNLVLVFFTAALGITLGSEYRSKYGTENPYYGRLIGKLQEYAHGIKGTAYAVDDSTIFVKGFSYDGTGPDAFFWVGNSARPSPEGYIIPYPEDYMGRDPPILNAYNKTDVILRLPLGKRIRDIKWLSVWCRRFTVNFGDVFIPPNLEVPKARVLPEFRRLAHGLRSGNISILDAKTFYIPNLHYDGAGPDAYFWVGNGSEPNTLGIKVPNEIGSLEPLRGYQGEDIELQLPGNLTVYDIDWLAVWCVQYRHNFGHVNIPKDLDVPPALGQTKITITSSYFHNGAYKSGIKYHNVISHSSNLAGFNKKWIWRNRYGRYYHYLLWDAGKVSSQEDIREERILSVAQTIKENPKHYKSCNFFPLKTSSTTGIPKSETFSNCREMLDEKLQVQWEMKDDYIQIQLAGRIRDDQYMAFGLSGENGRSSMIGGDIVVAYYDSEHATFHAVDYYMSATSQCDGKNGVCPDERIGGQNDVVLLSGDRKSGVTTVSYRRPLQTNEPINDRAIPSEGEVSVIAAIGPLNARKEANAHAIPDKTTDDIRIDFSSRNDHSCTVSLFTVSEEDAVQPWKPAVVIGENIFSARIGPTAGKRGYTPITNHPSWGISWWINDKLIPEIYVERGQTYTFIVEGGNDPTNPARYHPFYITDNSEAGLVKKMKRSNRDKEFFAGVNYDSEGYPYPTSAGRYCEWTHKTIDRSEESETFEEYFQTLRLVCDNGEAAILNWTVPKEAPDLLYYQCYTHNNLGWKIHIVNTGYSLSQNETSTALSILPFTGIVMSATLFNFIWTTLIR